MISQILPHIVGATYMFRSTETGAQIELSGDELRKTRHDPLSGIYPESFGVTVPEEIHPQRVIYMLGYACKLHRALLKVLSMEFGNGVASAICAIDHPVESFRGVLVVRGKEVMFFMSPQAGV